MSSEVIAFVVTSVLLPLVLTELGDWCSWLAKRLARWTARRLGDPVLAERYAEEWTAELAEVPGKLGQLITALGYVAYLPRMRWTLRRQRQKATNERPQLEDLLQLDFGTSHPLPPMIGRLQELETLYAQFTSDEQSGLKRRYYVIAGQAAIGKTMLARAFRDLLVQEERKVAVIRWPRWRDALFCKEKRDQLVAELGEDTLLIVDDAEAETIRMLERLDLLCPIMITIRCASRVDLPDSSYLINLGSFSAEQARMLLSHYWGPEAVEAEREAVQRLCDLANGNPLALTLLGRLSERGSLPQLQARLRPESDRSKRGEEDVPPSEN